MFAKTVVQSSKFLRMPATSRLLYYDIGMNADDDGYCEWYPVLQMTGAKEQDMQVLQANGFVQIFDSNVLIVKDWKENNYIQVDRYNKSKYLDIYSEKMALDNNSVESIQNVSREYTQVRLGKVRIGKDNTTSDKSDESFDQFWKEYPRKEARGKSESVWKKKKLSNFLPEILAFIAKARETDRWKKGFIPHATTFLNGQRWTDDLGLYEDKYKEKTPEVLSTKKN